MSTTLEQPRQPRGAAGGAGGRYAGGGAGGAAAVLPGRTPEEAVESYDGPYPAGFEVTAPGFYFGMPEETYHADPVPGGSLSYSGMKAYDSMTPRQWAYEQAQPHEASAAMEVGTVVHAEILGTGSDVVLVDADSWRTKDAQTKRDEARAAGKVPMLVKDYGEQVRPMVTAVRADPLARAALEGTTPEVSFFYRDPVTGEMLRGRCDALGETWDGRPRIVDVKTLAGPCTPYACAEAARKFSYDRQAANYTEGVAALAGVRPEDVEFTTVFVSKDAPHDVLVVSAYSDRVLVRASEANRRTVDSWARAKAAGFPGNTKPVRLDFPDYLFARR